MAKEIQLELPYEEIDPMEPLQKATETEAGVDELSATQSAEAVTAAQGVDKQNAIASLDHLKKNEDFSKALKKAYSNVEDEYLSGMPQSIWNAYKSGEFGNIKKHEAKDENGETIYKKDKEGNNVLDKNGKTIPVMEYDDPDAAKKARSTRNYFAWNAIGNALANVANKTNNSSDWDKVKTTNLEKALERRNKLKEDQMNTMTDKLKAIAGNDTEMMKAVDMFRNNQQFASIMANQQNENEVLRAFDVLSKVSEKVGKMTPAQQSGLISAMLLTGKGDLKSAVGVLLNTEDGQKLLKSVIELGGDVAGALSSVAESVGAFANGGADVSGAVESIIPGKTSTTRDGEKITNANATGADGKPTAEAKKLNPAELEKRVGKSVLIETLKEDIPGASEDILKHWKKFYPSTDYDNFVKVFAPKINPINEEINKILEQQSVIMSRRRELEAQIKELDAKKSKSKEEKEELKILKAREADLKSRWDVADDARKKAVDKKEKLLKQNK